MSLTNLSSGKALSSSKSTESLYSSTSAKSAIHRRMMQRQMGRMSGNNEVRQRVASARMLRLKTLQNNLNDALQHITNLTNENRLLRTLHKRQDLALSKYESSNAELPQLLQSHAEEVRIWQGKYRGLHSQNRELAHKMKQKDAMLIQLSDQNKHLTQLNSDRKLEEREALTNRVRSLESKLGEKDEEIRLLERKNSVMERNLKSQLALEHQKLKEMGTKYEMSLIEAAKSSTSISERQAAKNQLRRPVNSLLPRAIPTQNNRQLRHHSRDRSIELKLSNDKSLDSIYRDISPRKRTARIIKDLTNGGVADGNGNHNGVDVSNPRKKVLHVHNPAQYYRPDSDSDVPPDEATYTKSDEDYAESFERDSDGSRSLPITKARDDYDDDNDLVLLGDTKNNQRNDDQLSDEYEHLFTNMSLHEQTKNNLSKLRTEYQGDILQNESVLDSLCDSLCKDVEIAAKNDRGNSGDAPKFGDRILNVKKTPVAKKRTKMDEKKKSDLLAALKAIDSNGSGDK